MALTIGRARRKRTKGGNTVKKILAGFVVGLLVVGMTGTASANLIINGSFEMGTFSNQGANVMTLPVGATDMLGWTVVIADIAWINTPNSWGISASTCDFFLDLNGYDNAFPFGGVSQTVTTAIGQQYTLSFDLGTGPSGVFGAPISVMASAGSASQVFTLDLNDTWQTFGFDFVTQEAGTLISIIGNSGTQYIGLDSVSLTMVPVPATILLFGSGLLGIAGIIQSRKEK